MSCSFPVLNDACPGADVDGLFAALQDRVEVIEPPHDTGYGMREFIFRDINRFWITFGQEIPAR